MSRTLFAALALVLPATAVAEQAPSSHVVGPLGEVALTLAGLDASSCLSDLEGSRTVLQTVDVTALEAGELALAVDAVWGAQRQAHQTLGRLHGEGPVGEACVDGFRRLDVALRTTADDLLLAQGEASPWRVTEELASFDDLRSGDVLVTRGGALSSAGIAHIGAVPSSFSHNALIYVDPEGGAWTVEAYLEKGGLVQPLEDFLAHGVGRIVVLRYDDEALAARAAHLAYQRVAHGPAIPYDEAFDTASHDELFCSEIVPWALELARGPDDVPLHRTRFDHDATPELFAGMGIEVADLAAPADLVFDPRFRMVGEWRDLHALPELQRQDAVVDGLFRWMATQDLSPAPTWTHRATVDVGLAARRTPVLREAVRERLHPDGDRGFLVAALALQDAGQRLYDAVVDEVGAPGSGTPRPELDQRIDAVLAQDAVSSGRGRVHRVLRPTGRR